MSIYIQTMINYLFSSKISKIGYQDVQNIINNREYIIVNTLPSHEQMCLIKNTISINEEQTIINEYISKYNYKKKIVVYGKNSCDESSDSKAAQLLKLGFTNVYLYSGGLFEWLLLQDIYGEELFKTTSTVKDILLYKPTYIL